LEPHRLEAGEKGIELLLNLDNGSEAIVDRDLFTLVLDEVFRNAVYYADAGGTVRVDTFRMDGKNGIRISNTGSKVTSRDAGRVFDRFWRGSRARADTGRRFGLGLPIVGKVSETMGITLEVESEVDGEFVVTMHLPAG
jgi:signal transduction histidine kinase